MKTRRKFVAAALLAVAATPLGSLFSPAVAAESKVQLMFVQSADGLKADDKTLRLINVAPQTIYFSDRPERIAGHITLPAYLEEWTAAAGPNNFSKDPPNATLSVYEPGQGANTLTVVEISKPVVDGKDLVYSYKLIEGKMPKAGGATALFIDWIGPGGGVGVGFHGVGVGRRGVGWR
ncbi:hypothetical protein [Accumulibacter sp.]|uniref:hypothetical protein n=1 Tax=Accumulibacter sp. TaxID=2053492 RepID=UPI002621D943|nr:hypothetical protein [Accumulibacter sp.]